MYATCSVQGEIAVVFVMKAMHSEFMCRRITGGKRIGASQFVSYIRNGGGALLNVSTAFISYSVQPFHRFPQPHSSVSFCFTPQ
jgi:hypothetical protein